MERLATWWWTLVLLCAGVAVGCGKNAAMDMTTRAGHHPAAEAAYDYEEDAASFDGAVVMESQASSDDAGRALGGALLKSRAPTKLAEAAPPPGPAGGAPGRTPNASTPAEDPNLSPAPDATDATAGPLLVYTARLNLSVFETAKSLEAVEALAREAGGYLVVRDDQSITIRVPAARFRGVLSGVTALGDVLARNVEVRDVTEEYYDLEIRLRNQEAVLVRLQELLHRANDVEAALKVEAELSRVATEVERMKGRLKLLRELVAYSTITVTFAPTVTERIGSRVRLPFPWLEDLGLGSLLNL